MPEFSDMYQQQEVMNSDDCLSTRRMVMRNELQLANTVREACLIAAQEAYENAGMSGLCGEGRWELAMQAIKTLDLGRLICRASNDN
jgi:hypothetical protein